MVSELKEQIKDAARRLGSSALWSKAKTAWAIKGKHVTDKDIFDSWYNKIINKNAIISSEYGGVHGYE